MDRRRHARHEHYFPLRFGDADTEHDALTRDVSAGGLFVATREIYSPGTRLWLNLVIEPQRPLLFEVAVVRRLDALPVSRDERGFGVRFVSPTEVFARYFPTTEGLEGTPVSLSFSTYADLTLAAQRGLIDGYAFVWSNEEKVAGERVALTLTLAFANRTLEVGARVTQVVVDGARFGLALELDDTTDLRELLSQPPTSEP